MTARAIRLDPPAVELTPERRWVLLRAFSPPDVAWGGEALDAGAVLASARALALDARIASRIPHPRLEAEIGAEATGALVAAYRMAAVQGMLIAGAERVVADAARRAGTAAVLLKHAAVSRLAGLPPGARAACDLDVLVPERAVPALREALAAQGFRQCDYPDVGHHHDVPMVHPSGAMVELHVSIPGVALNGRDTTHEAVMAAGLAQPAEGVREGLLLPARELVVAHLLAHGLHQHLLAPESYPLMRMVSDLVDLGLSREEARRLGPTLAEWIGPLVPETLVRAAAELAELLGEARERGGERGESAGTAEGEGAEKSGASGALGWLAPPGMTSGGKDRNDARVLLDHILAGAFDPAYARSLRWPALLEALRAASGRKRMLVLWHSVWLTRGQVDTIYGGPRSAIGYLGLRLWRPFDVMLRALRYGAAWARGRVRSGCVAAR